MQVIDQFSDISDRFDAVFCDVWGCIHNGVNAFPAAISALQSYRKNGGQVLLLTNAPRPWQRVASHLDTFGISPSSWDAILTSGDAAKLSLFNGRIGRQIFYIGPARDDEFLQRPKEFSKAKEVIQVGLDEATGIVCTGLFDDHTETPEDYRDLLARALAKKLPFLCANPDRVVDRGTRRIYCAGALADLYSAMGGEVLLFGKPTSPIYELAFQRLGQSIASHRVLCIGDGFSTDLEGARQQSLACLFITGGLAARETGTRDQPDLKKLVTFCRKHQLKPEFAMGHLR